MLNVYIGYDSREPKSFAVCRESIRKYSGNIEIKTLHTGNLRNCNIYKREHVKRNGKTYDVISDAPMATEFAITRFLVPFLNQYKGTSVFMDSDIMLRTDIRKILKDISFSDYALACVKHDYTPSTVRKMDGQLQTLYKRKNWSSVMVFNNEHPANRRLNLEYVNRQPGRVLHAFDWLKDDEIAELPIKWNYLVGEYTPDVCPNPNLIHWTLGSPELIDDETLEYRNEFNMMLKQWVLNG